MIVSLIVAMDEKGGIGKNNQIPWHLPSDLKHFKQLTMGHHLVMGRKTYETIGKPLVGRVMIVVTHRIDYSPSGCLIVHSLPEALKVADQAHEGEVFIIGGGEIFHQAIHLAEKIYLTTVHADVNANTLFPKINTQQWESGQGEEANQDKDEYPSDFKILVRKH